MSEIDRIISSGLVSREFLNDEIRCDFLVDSNRKKLWAVELDMLVQFDAVCKKHGLRYFLLFGTLLGAVRHHGFIPWDDDADVGMPREDYNRLLALKDEFKNPLFLQSHETDPEYYISWARLRNSNTTAISPLIRHQKMNQGIFLDIFPLDNLLYNEGTERFDKIRALNINNGTFMRMKNPDLDEKNRLRVQEYIAAKKDPQKDYESIQTIAQQNNHLASELISNLVCTISPLSQKSWNQADFQDVVPVELEGFQFNAPAGFENVLKTSYGDYLQLPKVEDRGKQHGQYLFNPDQPYEKYLV